MTPRRGARAVRQGRALLAVLLAALGCSRGEAPERRPVPSPPASAGPALLEFSRPRHDFGEVVQGELLRTSFQLLNAGARALHLEATARAQTCQAEARPTELAPGARGNLDVVCRAELHGPLRVSLPLRSNDARSRELELTAEVTPLLAFDTELVAFEMPFGETREQEVRLRGARAREAKLSLVADSRAGFDLEWLMQAGAPPRFRVRYAGKTAGTVVGNLVFRTELASPSEIRLPYSVRVQGTLTVTPTNPFFNLRAGGPKVQYLEVSSRQPGFRVKSVSVRGGPFAAQLEAGKIQSVRIKLTVLEEQLGDEARSALGTLTIRSNDASEPLREVPLFAFGRLNRSSAGVAR